MQKKLALATIVALSLAAAPAANAGWFSGALTSIKDKAKGAAKDAVAKAGNLFKEKYESIKTAAKTETTGLRNALASSFKKFAAAEVASVKKRGLQFGKGLMKGLQDAGAKAWESAKKEAVKGFKAGKGKNFLQNLKFGMSAGWKAGWKTFRKQGWKNSRAAAGKAFKGAKKDFRANLDRFRKHMAKRGVKAAKNVAKAAVGKKATKAIAKKAGPAAKKAVQAAKKAASKKAAKKSPSKKAKKPAKKAPAKKSAKQAAQN